MSLSSFSESSAYKESGNEPDKVAFDVDGSANQDALWWCKFPMSLSSTGVYYVEARIGEDIVWNYKAALDKEVREDAKQTLRNEVYAEAKADLEKKAKEAYEAEIKEEITKEITP